MPGAPPEPVLLGWDFLIRLILKPAMAKSGDYGDQEKRLIARGVLTPPVKERSSTPLPEPPGNVSDEVMEQVWREERDDR